MQKILYFLELEELASQASYEQTLCDQVFGHNQSGCFRDVNYALA